MLKLLGELTALAAVVAISPFTIIPALALVLHSARPRSTGLAFIGGWLVSKAAVTILFLQVPRLLQQIDRAPDEAVSAWVRIILGMLLLGAAVAQWRRPGRIESPRWLTRIKEITPGWSAVAGVALTVANPKLVLACAGAGYAIGTAGLGPGADAVAVVYFTLLGGSSAAVPILAYAVASHRIDPHLERFRAWLQRHGTTLLLVSLVVIGTVLVLSGLRAL
ncbi:GAP family protein [Mycobacterium sp. ACS4331]|uniref:GAP family protein n=1 Tax=Mycobacterium sp. ACS4331 TaxID=1834121 RepID=UPI000801CF11|nr:GAP family protein [Mycobacterium sp. ACS4331]OBF16370.1 hypothetical protein A5727_13875 [Mycobacterium sp. ACS4331]